MSHGFLCDYHVLQADETPVLYDKGIREITLLYPENEMPDFSFMYNYDYLWTEDKETGGLKIDYSYYSLWRRGDYYVLTVIMP